MKKFLIPLFAATLLAVTSGANATTAAVPLTNIVQNINIALSYTSPVLYGDPPTSTSTNWNVTRKVNGKETNFLNITVSRAITNIVVTKNIIQALLPGAPVGSTLVLVQFTNGASSQVQIRSGGSNLLTVTALTVADNLTVGADRTVTTTTTITNAITKKLTTSVVTTTSMDDVKFVTFKLVNSLIGFQLTGVESSTLAPVVIGRTGYTANETTASPLVGTGNDARGANEIVQGTITVGLPRAGF
jgi:hypothetical protein